MSAETLDERLTRKMDAAGVGRATIDSFLAAVHQVQAGERGMIPESDLEPVPDLPRLDALPADAVDEKLLRELAVIKLNGGLGTGMGLNRAKSLLPVKEGKSFLDYIARQILHLRRGGSEPAFYLMDSYATREDSLAALAGHPALSRGEPLDFLQSKVPKLLASTLEPVEWPGQPDLEWCPPGHGDLYPSLVNTGLLDRLLGRGIRVLFVSNSDNLGATVDLRILTSFAGKGLSFLMEVAARTPADRKGGHLARRRKNGRLILRESAQTPDDEAEAFQDIERHRFFNTNNLWIRLDHLKSELDRNRGVLRLPLIANSKTVDPRDPDSPRVLQLESAMGAAIECFENSGALVVGRDRFTPVKSTDDLLTVRSDAYRVTEDGRLLLEEARQGRPPLVKLDRQHYGLLEPFESMFPSGAPSLLRCDSLSVEGPVIFSGGVVCRGDVRLSNRTGRSVELPPGVYADQDRSW